MLEKYLFIPAIVTILGVLAIWSHHLDYTLDHQQPNLPRHEMSAADLKFSQPHRGLTAVQIAPPPSQELEIEPLDSN